jgi:hypothetical protein
MERCLWVAERVYEKRSFHGKTQPRNVQSKTERSQQVIGLYPNWKKNSVRQDNKGIWKVIARRWNQVHYGTSNPNWMDRELVGTWKRILEIQESRRPAEHAPSAVVRRSAEADYCKNGWKNARQTKWRKKKK